MITPKWSEVVRFISHEGLAAFLALVGLGFFAGVIPSPVTSMATKLDRHIRDQKALMALVHQICRNGSWKPTPSGPQFDPVLQQRCDTILFRIVPEDADVIVNGK